MKICLYNRHAYSLFSGEDGAVGGAERAMANLARQVAQDGAEVSLITQANSLREPVMLDGVRIVPLHHRKRPLFGVIRSRPDLLAKFLWDTYRAVRDSGADVVLVSQAAIETMAVVAGAQSAGIPVVYRIASNMELDHTILRDTMLFGREWLARRFERLLTQVDAVVAQTPEQAEIIRKRFGRQVPVIANMMTMSAPELSAQALREKNTVLWVGRSHPMKRPEVFMQLARSMPDTRFVAIVSPAIGEAEYMRELTLQAAQIPNLEWVPGLRPDEVQAYYAKARLFVMTSESEGFPNVMAEAMLNGAPCVSTLLNPGGWLSDDLTVAAAGWRCGEERLADFVQELLPNDDLINQSAVLCHRKVLDNMMPAAVTAQYMQVLRDVVDKSKTKTRRTTPSLRATPPWEGN